MGERDREKEREPQTHREKEREKERRRERCDGLGDSMLAAWLAFSPVSLLRVIA